MRPSTGIQEILSPNSQNKGTSGRKDCKDEQFFIFTILMSRILRDNIKCLSFYDSYSWCFHLIISVIKS